MKPPDDAALIVRCPTGKGCALAYVHGETVWVSEWSLRLGVQESQPTATQARIKSGTAYNLQEELEDPTNCLAACRCGNWAVNVGSIAQMARDGITGSVMHEGTKMPSWQKVSK